MNLSPTLMALHVLGCVGFVVIVSMGRITAPVRQIWPSMMSCSMCFGVWGGMAWGSMLLIRPSLPESLTRLHDVIAFACAASCLGFLVSLADSVVGALNNRSPQKH